MNPKGLPEFYIDVFANCQNEHENKSFRGFGSYGDILIRDRKMYVAPTPFGLLNGVEGVVTLLLPKNYPVDKRLVSVGSIDRVEADRIVVSYTFNMKTNELKPKFIPNPSAGTVHSFRAYRLASLRAMNAIGPQVTLK